MVQQNWNASEYQQHAAFVALLAEDLIDLLNPQPGEQILDIGCGDGRLSAEIQQRGCTVTGIDSSPSMVAASKKRGVQTYLLDAHHLFDQSALKKGTFEQNTFDKNNFDAVFSNATLHWLNQPEKVIQGVHATLKSQGRFVAEFGGHGNIATLLKAMKEVFDENSTFGEFRHPWYFPTPEQYRALLEKHGFKVKNIELISRPTPLNSGLEKWLEIFANSITGHLTPEQNKVFLVAVTNKLVPLLHTQENGWVADYVRLRFEAIKL